MLKKIIGIMALGMAVLTMNAQQDYTNTKNPISVGLSQPDISASIHSIESKKNVWKLNALGSLLNGINVSYERMIAPKWSINVNSVTNFDLPEKNKSNLQGLALGNIRYYRNVLDIYHSEALQVRYYHNLERRQRLNKRTDFSENYFTVEIAGGYNRSNYSLLLFPGVYIRNNFVYSASFLYGVQRRILGKGYFDASVGISTKYYQGGSYHQYTIGPVTKLGLGIAF